ncbi:MAG: nucleotidyltransferase domain-containing protein [Candidatus Harrisonbacteria bacterium]|nr:nucleotidyltransferase domain-containing protein [Candidatus Harrisonbacteria bacterium]
MTLTTAMIQEKLHHIFAAYPEAGFVYLFGSRARGEASPTSDYDIAVYLDEPSAQKRGELRMTLITDCMKALGSNEIDLHILNDMHTPELKYKIIAEGKLMFEREPYRVLIEPKIMNEYFDFSMMLQKYNFTKS